MAAIIKAATGLDTRVVDVTIYGPDVPLYDGAIEYDGTYVHDSHALPIYGLFDVVTGFDLEGLDSDIAAYVATITAQVERLRAGGYLLRQVLIEGGDLADVAAGPAADPSDVASLGLAMVLDLTEASAGADADPDVVGDVALDEDPVVPTEDETVITADFTHTLDGSWLLDGSRPLSSGVDIEIDF